MYFWVFSQLKLAEGDDGFGQGDQDHVGKHDHGGDPGGDSYLLGLASCYGHHAETDVEHQQNHLGRKPAVYEGVLCGGERQDNGAHQQNGVVDVRDNLDPALIQFRGLQHHP